MLRCPALTFSSISLTQEPKFIDVFWIPESENPDDDKIFFFFRETAVEGSQGLGKQSFARIGQICRVRLLYGLQFQDEGGQEV